MGFPPEVIASMRNHPVAGDFYRERLDAADRGELPNYYRRRLLDYKTDYSDELPLEDVRPIIKRRDPQLTRKTQYKCQDHFLWAVCLTLRGALGDGVIEDEELRQDIEGFIGSNPHFEREDPLPQKQALMDRVNGMLNRTIAYLTPTEPITSPTNT